MQTNYNHNPNNNFELNNMSHTGPTGAGAAGADGVVLRRSQNNSDNNHYSYRQSGDPRINSGVSFNMTGTTMFDNPGFINDNHMHDVHFGNIGNGTGSGGHEMMDTTEGDEFESMFNGGPKRQSEELKAWDRFKTIPPPDDDETLSGEWLEIIIKWFKVFAYFFTFVVTLGFAVISKSFILLMTSMIKVNRTIPLCNEDGGIYQIEPPLDRDKRYTTIYAIDDPERIAWLWTLFFATITPELFVWGRSARICYFKTYKIPEWRTFLTVFTTETFNAIGISLLIFLILPTIDSIKGAMITNSICLIPGLLLLLSTVQDNDKLLNRILTLLACCFQFAGLIVWPIIVHDDGSRMYWYLPLALIMVSFTWWENYVDPGARLKPSANIVSKWLDQCRQDLARSRYFTYLIVSLWKCLVILSMMILIEYLNEDTATVGTMFSRFGEAYRNYDIAIIRDKSQFEHQTPMDGDDHIMSISDPYVPVWVLLVQITASYMCYAVGKFSCKICIQGVSFAIPVNMAVPFTVSFLWAMVSAAGEDKCQICNFWPGFQYVFWYTREVDVFAYNENAYNYVNTFMWILSLASQMWIAIHIWFSTSERLASTEKLFIIPMYSSICIDQSLAMNRRRLNVMDDPLPVPADKDGQPLETAEEALMTNTAINASAPTFDSIQQQRQMDHMYESVTEPMAGLSAAANGAGGGGGGGGLVVSKPDETVTIYVCTTMWHESKDEMIQTLKAVIRLDADQCARKTAQEFFQLNPSLTDYYEIEFNIFFDDAFDQGVSDDEDDRVVNRFVRQLVETMDEAASYVHETIIQLQKPNVVPTPYGGKLEWTLPGQNKLIAHLKDKILIRHRKRWSQCMYMYYLLGYRLAAKPMDERRKETIAMNTFILALDGDINFRPTALNLVVDLMKKNKKLGAACGRIHPIGPGPMVWYQKFEYAIGHWLQKATEHVFGCVLCSPGCFSLFRARAVMDDSVMNKYTTKPSEALHYVQYDQGEDRWLCTLLLQQGWRIEYCAASDSYTHAPEGFGEFYTQRRRWAPSTMANIMDLLGDYKRTVAVNNDISKLYILYQAMMMIGTVLSPGTIFLMVVGAVNTVLGLTSTVSIVVNVIPVLLFSIVCMTVKKNDHIIFLAMILSTIYALVMLAVYVGICIDMFQKTIFTPNSMFFLGLMGSFVIAAIIHPQEFSCVIPLPLYMLLIPSMYLLLTIYSVTNMHIVSWGTREVKSKLTAKEAQQAAEAAAEAEAAKAKKKNMLGFLNLSQLGGGGGRGSGGILTCMCCSSQRSDEESAKLTEIREQLTRMSESVTVIKTQVTTADQSEQYSLSGGRRNTLTSIRRQSSTNRAHVDRMMDAGGQGGGGGGGGLSTIEAGDTEDETSDRSSMDSMGSQETGGPGGGVRSGAPSIAESKMGAKLPRWVGDKTFKKFPIVPLEDDELDFWQTFIPKYLLPLDENPKEQARIASDLRELRNKMVFAFAIINTLFILFVLLLQMHPDVFNFEIKTGIDHWNITGYNEKEDKYDKEPVYHYIKMDPIGLVLVAFFGIILVIQLIGMFMHRFGTLAHLLAFTNIDFCQKGTAGGNEDDDAIIDKNIVQITKQLQKLKGLDDMDDQNTVVLSSDNLPNNRKSMFGNRRSRALSNIIWITLFVHD
ncbi:chitin synthase chs-2-like [Oppia nitens]|uniref:chitin synthase chs-2-like n=1 Tax=Oppia nitens TaxID=1686743 RepID=UPI0023DAF5EB|nr:chitin synthase chs-2-like [Oppia nitens]